jgi:hypothetical protein
MRTLSFAVRNYVGAGVITPDETLENFIREATDLPPVDMATRREVLTPQDPNAEDEEGEEGEEDKKDPGKNVKPPKAGPPRQSKPKPAPTNKGGNDRSGGK